MMIDKQNAIATTFCNLLLDYPYDKITIKSICDQTPVNRSSFYYHFESKEKLVEWICLQDFMKYCLPYFSIHTDNISTKSFFNYIKRKKAFYLPVAKVKDGQLLQNCLAVSYAKAALFVNEYGNLTKNELRKIDSRVYHRYSAAGIASVVLFWIQQEMAIPIEDIAYDLRVMLTNSLENVRDNYLY